MDTLNYVKIYNRWGLRCGTRKGPQIARLRGFRCDLAHGFIMQQIRVGNPCTNIYIYCVLSFGARLYLAQLINYVINSS